MPTPKTPPKPRPLNALYADLRCSVDNKGRRWVSADVTGALNLKETLRLAGWLADAAEWLTAQPEIVVAVKSRKKRKVAKAKNV